MEFEVSIYDLYVTTRVVEADSPYDAEDMVRRMLENNEAVAEFLDEHSATVEEVNRSDNERV